jgi:hypothetical protein
MSSEISSALDVSLKKLVEGMPDQSAIIEFAMKCLNVFVGANFCGILSKFLGQFLLTFYV